MATPRFPAGDLSAPSVTKELKMLAKWKFIIRATSVLKRPECQDGCHRDRERSYQVGCTMQPHSICCFPSQKSARRRHRCHTDTAELCRFFPVKVSSDRLCCLNNRHGDFVFYNEILYSVQFSDGTDLCRTSRGGCDHFTLHAKQQKQHRGRWRK